MRTVCGRGGGAGQGIRTAFLETGGTEEEWAAHNIEIKVWYEVKTHTDRYLSVAVTGAENWTSAYSETRYYNFDLEKGRQVTLSDLLAKITRRSRTRAF